MQPIITIEHGSPRVAGTRITVYDVYHYLQGGHWTHEQISDILGISLPEVEAAARYIDEHRAEVEEADRLIEERNTRGTSPEVHEKMKGVRERIDQFLKQRRAATGGIDARNGR